MALASDGCERALGTSNQEGGSGSTYGNDPSDRPVAIGDLHLSAALNFSQMQGQLILQLSDLHPLHGYM